MTNHSPLLCHRMREVQILQLNHLKSQNPINEAMRLALCGALRQADADSGVTAIVITGGPGRSFCAGGDFAEVSQFHSPQLVREWIDAVLELYISVLECHKPVVIALDGYAIGMGLQLALMGDWRVAGEDSRLSMWELKAGVACTVGACILRHCLGRLAATQIIYGCEMLSGADALKMHLVEDLVPTGEVLDRAIERAEQLASYPKIPFCVTKRSINAPFIEELRQNAQISAEAHISSFAAKSSDQHMRSVLKL
jgi:carboxymethylproline synthase